MQSNEKNTQTSQNLPAAADDLAVGYLLHNCEEAIYQAYDAYNAGLLTAEEAMRIMTRQQIVEVKGWQ